MQNHWKTPIHTEHKYNQECLKALQSCSWANNLIQKANKLGFTEASMPTHFEVRFAYALSKTGLVIQNGYKSGTKNSEIKDSDVDFCVTEGNGTKWLIELTSLDESKEVKENTWVAGNVFGCTLKDPTKFIIRAQGAVFEKVAKRNKKNSNETTPTKFLIPEKKDQFNIIIIDMRGFAIGGPDRHDYKAIIEGGDPFQNPATKQWEEIKGIFDPLHPDTRTKFLQERIHGVGFLNEKNYIDEEIEEILELFPNPNLFNNTMNLNKIFPLKKSIIKPIIIRNKLYLARCLNRL